MKWRLNLSSKGNVGGNIEEVESNDTYVEQVFVDEGEAYDTYNPYAL